MRISFDLDDTLICYQPGTPCEPRPAWYWRLLVPREPLRAGARELLQTLCARGWELWVYTTSHRSRGSVRRWLRAHGVRVAGVINQDVHDRRLREATGRPSKNPRAFGIDLHVDDSDGVRVEGERHDFRVVVVAPGDGDWAEKVLAAADGLRRASPGSPPSAA